MFYGALDFSFMTKGKGFSIMLCVAENLHISKFLSVLEHGKVVNMKKYISVFTLLSQKNYFWVILFGVFNQQTYGLLPKLDIFHKRSKLNQQKLYYYHWSYWAPTSYLSQTSTKIATSNWLWDISTPRKEMLDLCGRTLRFGNEKRRRWSTLTVLSAGNTNTFLKISNKLILIHNTKSTGKQGSLHK